MSTTIHSRSAALMTRPMSGPGLCASGYLHLPMAPVVVLPLVIQPDTPPGR